MDYKRLKKEFDERVKDREAFFDRIGISSSAFYKICKYGKSRVETLEKISNGLGLPMHTWWEGESSNGDWQEGKYKLECESLRKKAEEQERELSITKRELVVFLELLEEKMARIKELEKGSLKAAGHINNH